MKIILIALLSLSLINCSSDPNRSSESNSPVKNTKSYNEGPAVLFGDSIARGAGASSKDESLFGCLSSINNNVINLANDGATSQNAYDVVTQASSLNPSLVLISLGGNDVLQSAFENMIPTQETTQNVRSIFKEFTNAGSLVIYLDVTPPSNLVATIDTSRLQTLKSIARQEGVVLVEESMKGLWGNILYMSDDIHPNDAGYAIICDRINQAIEPHLK